MLTALSAGAAERGAWYSGDLHMHSTYSDGDSPVSDVVAKAESLGLDYIAITDHDSSMNGEPVHWYDPGYQSDTLILLYGVEWTSSMGHANVWATAPYDYSELWAANRATDADAAIAAAHEQGVLFSINHPAAYACCPWEYEQTQPVDAVEVWNSIYRIPNFNPVSIHQFWDELLLEGLSPTAVGGSDLHLLKFPGPIVSTIGNPTTWVFAAEPTPAGILAGISAGHVTISYASYAPRLELDADTDGDGTFDAMMGDEVQGGRTIDFRIRLVFTGESERNRPGRAIPVEPALVRALSNGTMTPAEVIRTMTSAAGVGCGDTHLVGVFKNGHIRRAVLLGCGVYAYSFHEQPGPGTYYRLEAWGPLDVRPIQHPIYGLAVAVSNPIYIR